MRAFEIRIKKLNPDAKLPYHGSEAAAGYDVFAVEETKIPPGKSVLIPTGLALEIPPGHFLELCPRGSLVMKHNLDMPHSVGIIDSDFRGELFVPLRNLDTKKTHTIAKHERIAQIILQSYCEMNFSEVKKLNNTKRGDGMFGSTGKF
ncbi:dUTP diphosphatase [Patescibacteria group bacterium]